MKDLTFIGLMLVVLAAWLTHVVVCLMQAKYLLLIAGGIIFPIGAIHGVGVWFGASW